jgi:hypothetical protein
VAQTVHRAHFDPTNSLPLLSVKTAAVPKIALLPTSRPLRHRRQASSWMEPALAAAKTARRWRHALWLVPPGARPRARDDFEKPPN